MYKNLFLIVLFLFFSNTIFAETLNNESYVIVKFNIKRSQQAEIFKMYELNICDAHINKDNTITALMPRKMYEKARKNRSDITVIEENADNLFNKIKARGGVRAAGYHNYQSTKDEFKQLAKDHSDICRYKVVGKSIEGRDIFALKISDNPDIDENEPAALYVGMHHSREWIAVEVPVGIANKLCKEYNSDPEIKKLVNNREVWIIPILNPDGYVYSQENYKMWRKNRRDNGDGSFGVDPNRNYSYKWGNVGASSNPSSDTYHGPKGFSEPCTQVIKKIAEREHFAVSISYHSYGGLILWPWSYTGSEISPQNELLKTLAIEMSKFNHYDPKQSSGLYPSMGDYDDFMHGVIGAMSFTTELANQFIPDESQIPGIVKDNVAAAIHLLKRAGNLYPVAKHQPLVSTTDSNGPYKAIVNLDIKHHNNISVKKAELHYKTTGFYSTISMDKNNDKLIAEIPGFAYGTKISYYIELEVKGEPKLRFPETGDNTFSVCAENVLIVDNDNGKEYEKYFVDAVSSLNTSAVSVIDPTKTKITNEYLKNYTAVIWLSGSRSSNVISRNEMKVLKEYFNNGGSIFITGQDFGYALKKDDFMKDFLHTEFVNDNAKDHEILGKGFFEGIKFLIKGGDGASNQSYPDVLKPLDNAESVLTYSNGKCAATTVKGTGKIVYLGFGFEAVSTKETRDLLMKKIMEFLKPTASFRLKYLANLNKTRTDMLNSKLNEKEYMNIIGRQNFLSDIIVKQLTDNPSLYDNCKYLLNKSSKLYEYIIDEINTKNNIK